MIAGLRSPRLTSAGQPDPIPAATRRAWVREHCRREGIPTPGLIYCRATLIRNRWSGAEERARRRAVPMRAGVRDAGQSEVTPIPRDRDARRGWCHAQAVDDWDR